MSLHDIYYAFPEAAYLILVSLILAGLLLYLYYYRKKQLTKFTSPKLLNSLSVPHSDFIYFVKALALCFAWIAATFALMQPMGYGKYPEELQKKIKKGPGRQLKPHNVIFLLDVSDSMTVKDNTENVSRLQLAKEIGDQIISRLAGQSIALDAFTSQVTELSPLTTDYLFVRQMLRQAQINEGGVPGTDLLQALTVMRTNYLAKDPDVLKTLILLTDGGDTLYETLIGTEKEKRKQAIVDLVKDGDKFQYRVFTIGVGSKQGQPIPKIAFEGKPVISAVQEDLLKQISQDGRGRYYFANDIGMLDLARDLISQMGQDPQYVDGKGFQQDQSAASENLIHKLYFQLPLGIAILLLAGTLFLPNQFARRIKAVSSALLIIAVSLPAVGSADSMTLMNEAKVYIDVEEYSQAREIYQNLLQGTLTPWQRAVVLYDLGTSFLLEKQWDQAIAVLNSVPVDDYPSPLLRYRVKYNTILAFIGKAQALTNKPQEAIKILTQAMKVIPSTETTHCDLEKAEGYSECSEVKNLTLLKDYIKQQLAVMLEKKTSDAILNSSFQEGLPLLLRGVNESFLYLDFLSQSKLREETELRNKFQQFFVKQSREWLKLWNFLRTKIPEAGREKRVELYTTAEKAFVQGNQLMEEGQFLESRKAYEASSAALKALLAMPPPPAPPPPPSKPAEKPTEAAAPKLQEMKPDEQVLQLMLQMEQDDRLQAPQPTIQKKELRPW